MSVAFNPNETYSFDAFGGLVRGSDTATVPRDPLNVDFQAYEAWVASGKSAAPYSGPSPLAPTCQLWQLQSVMTSAQWTAVTGAISGLNNATVTAFFAHGTNQIPANSTTLASIAASVGLSAANIQSLVAQAATVSIP